LEYKLQINDVLAQPYAKRFFVAEFITNYGNGMSPIALAFGILALPNGSANLLGLVLGITTAMFVIMAPFGGVIADKYGRARVVGLTDFAAGSILLIQVGYFATGDVPVAVLLIVNGCYGLLWGIFWPAFTGIMPTIVPKVGLQKANAINALMTNSGLILGAASAGFLIDAFGAAITLGIDAASFLLSGVMVFTLRHLTPKLVDSKNSMLDDLIHGWKVFTSFRWIVISVISFSFIVMCWAAAENVLGPLIALEHFDGASSWSIVITAESIGLLVGAIIAIKIKLKYPIRFLQISTIAITLYILSLAKPQPLFVIAFCAFLFGIVFDLWNTLWYTALHRKVPQRALSRVSAFDALGSMIFKPIGLAIAAPLASLIGRENLLYLLAAITVVAIVSPLISGEVRNITFEDLPNDKVSFRKSSES
jgi:MFS family permease